MAEEGCMMISMFLLFCPVGLPVDSPTGQITLLQKHTITVSVCVIFHVILNQEAKLVIISLFFPIQQP